MCVCDMYIFNIIVEAMKFIILLEKVTEIDCSRINYYTSSHVQFLFRLLEFVDPRARFRKFTRNWDPIKIAL